MPSPPPIFAQFDLIRVVNLPERADRRREMDAQFKAIGILGDPRIAYFPAIRADGPGPFLKVGSHGNFLARIALFREAAAQGASILILEDDCNFLVPEVFEASLPPNWDIFYGGFEMVGDAAPEDSSLIGSHCMAFSAEAAAAGADYLTRYLEPDFECDPIAVAEPGYNPAIRPPIDGAMVWMRRAYPQLVTCFERISVQRASRSDVSGGKAIDRLPVVRDAVALARRVRNRLFGRRGMSKRNLTFGAPRD